MTLYKASSMPKLAGSKAPKDRVILEFSKRKGIDALSYKDYKYLLCSLYVDGIERKISGSGLKDLDEYLSIWLFMARADSGIESGKTAAFAGLIDRRHIPAGMDQLLKDDANADCSPH